MIASRHIAPCIGVLLACLAATMPAHAACTGGGTSSLTPPAVSFLRSYRAAFGAPTRMAVDASGKIYVTDPAAGQVVVREPGGRIVARAAVATRPVSVAVGAAGRVYVGDAASGSVAAYDSDWNELLRLGQGDGEFGQPSDLSVDAASGNIYVADSAAQRVKVYGAGGVFLYSFGAQGSGDGAFKYPVGVFVDAAAARVLVADQLNYRIQVFDMGGAFVGCFGGHGSGPGKFNMPQAVTIDAAGRVYVADSVEGRIQVLDRSGDFVGYIGDFGDGAAQLRIPIGMVIDPSNRLFVAAANNARLEVFGLDTFADPETTVPAVIRIEPATIERVTPGHSIVAYLEVPGYAPELIDPASIVANGVPILPGTDSIGDRDGNGVAELRVEFAPAALLATAPADGVTAVLVSGAVSGTQLEGSATVRVSTCGPEAACSLGNADAQCNEAICDAEIGCTVRPRNEGAGCEDGNACSMDDTCMAGGCAGTALVCSDGNPCTDDSCDIVTGCVFTANAAPCDDASLCTSGDTCAGEVCSGAPMTCADDNPCTDDGCDAVAGCIFTANAAPCDDGSLCTGGDTCAGGVCTGARVSCDDADPCTDDVCDALAGCTYGAYRGPCDDGDPATVADACGGDGLCRGQSVTARYAVLQWPLESTERRAVAIAARAQVGGDVCAENVSIGRSVEVAGDAVAWSPVDRALTLRPGAWIDGNVVSGGGAIAGIELATVGGSIDSSGVAAEFDDCLAARYGATQRRAEFLTLAAVPAITIGRLRLGVSQESAVPAAGDLGSGSIVIDAESIDLASMSRLTIAGAASTEQVVVHVRGRLTLGLGASIVVEGFSAERLIFVVDGAVNLRLQTSLDGSLLAAGTLRLGSDASVNGAVLGRTIKLAPSARVALQPFVGW
ncbi:MAG: hypothetical protein HY899_10605 [Deltaproteobacteria bacterium]|nr:hypothetical protein [Deltaproteobacteria bacterium]